MNGMYTVIVILGCLVVCSSEFYNSKEHNVRGLRPETTNNEKINQRVINQHTIRLWRHPNPQTTDMQVSEHKLQNIQERKRRTTLEHSGEVDNSDKQYKQMNNEELTSERVFNNNNVPHSSSDLDGLNTAKLFNTNDTAKMPPSLAQKQDKNADNLESQVNSENEMKEIQKRSTDQDAIHTTQRPKLNSLILKHFGLEQRPNEPITSIPPKITENINDKHLATPENNTNSAVGISTRVMEDATEKVPDKNGWQAKKTNVFVYIAYSIAFLLLII